MSWRVIGSGPRHRVEGLTMPGQLYVLHKVRGVDRVPPRSGAGSFVCRVDAACLELPNGASFEAGRFNITLLTTFNSNDCKISAVKTDLVCLR